MKLNNVKTTSETENLTLFCPRISPLVTQSPELSLVSSPSELTGSRLLADGGRERETARRGSGGGASHGVSFSSLRWRASSISSNELRTIQLGDTDIISDCNHKILQLQSRKNLSLSTPSPKSIASTNLHSKSLCV